MPTELDLGLNGAAARQEPRSVYTPSRLNREARVLLERGFPALWVEGEISNLSRPSSGHWYFSLKDESAQLRCAMFRQRNLLARFTAKDGMHVQVRGRISLYEPRGEYQFIVDHIEEAGEGALRRQFEVLKTKLTAEGLFATERKRSLPRLPRRIGVITSPTGAAIRDILHVLQRRFCAIPVLIYPVQVQGMAASVQIARAIHVASVRRECDVLILARGGGSLEDLWPFNEERVARAIVASAIPIVSGVGHEVDFTIADFAADMRAPTPSGAAELVVPDSNEWLRNLAGLARRLASVAQRSLTSRGNRIAWLDRRLGQQHPGLGLRQRAQRLDEIEQRLLRSVRHGIARRQAELLHQSSGLRHASPAMRVQAASGRLIRLHAEVSATMRSRLERLNQRLAVAAGKLNAVSPLATLERGYAIVTDTEGRVLTDAGALKLGDTLHARLARGQVAARVERTSGGETTSSAQSTEANANKSTKQ